MKHYLLLSLFILLAEYANANDIEVKTPTLDTISSTTCLEASDYSICEIDVLGKRACYIDIIAAPMHVACSFYDYARQSVREIDEHNAVEASKMFR